MTRRGGSSDGTFYFQAWHVAKVVSGESWVQNKEIADFVEQNLGPATKKWLHVKGCVPTKEKPGLLIPYSICVKLRTPKSGQNPKEAEEALLLFRNEEFPNIAKTYFTTRLNKTLDFFNSYSEGADFDSPLANFDKVKTSKKLKERVRRAIKYVKKDIWGDMVHGLVDSASSTKAEFKAARFITRRGKGMYKDIWESDIVNICLDFSDPASDPNLLPPAPLQSPLPLPVVSPPAALEVPDVSPRPRTTSDVSDVTVDSTNAPGTDASSVSTVDTTQSSVIVEESSSELLDAKETSSESPVVLEEEEASTSPAVEDSSSEVQDAKETSESSIALEEDEASTSPAVEEDSAEQQDTEESSSELQDSEEPSSESSVALEEEETSTSPAIEEDSSEPQDSEEPSSESSIVLEEEESTTSPAAEEASSTTASASTTDTEVDAPDAVTPADSSEASYQETTTEPVDTTSAPTAISTPSSVVATRRKMNCVSPQRAQTAYFVVQNSGNWLRYLMASQGQSAQKLRSTFFDSPIILAAAIPPFQALNQDGMMRVYFMSQAKKQQDEVVCDEKGRAIRTRKGSKTVREWVVGTAKVSTHALTRHLGEQLNKRNIRLLPAASPAVRNVDSVVGPNNRLIEMTIAPDIPQAVLVTTPHPVEDVQEGDIVQEERDDGFVHIETNILTKPVEEVVSDAVEGAKNIIKEERKASKVERKTRFKGKLPATKSKSKTDTKTNAKTRTKKTTKGDQTTDTVKTDVAVDANSVPPRKPSKPQVIYDVMSGYDFVQVEDVQVFSFSTSSHDMMLRTTPAAHAAAVEEGEGIDVWSPPVVGMFSWMWDYLAPGGWPKATAAH
ncbi:hypothetical protein V8C42DRAFT_149693 [Trichoderma barbatum]